MGKKKKRHPDKIRGKNHGPRVFSDTVRGQRLRSIRERSERKSKLVVDYDSLAYALEEHIHAQLYGGGAGPQPEGTRRLIVMEQDAMDIFGMYTRGTLKLALGKYRGKSGSEGLYGEPAVSQAIVGFFEQGVHRLHVKRVYVG